MPPKTKVHTLPYKPRQSLMKPKITSALFKSSAPNPNAPSYLQKQPTAVFKVGKVPIKRKMMEQTPVAMANATTTAKYAPPRKSRKANRL